jgi:hypothetical protein
VGIPLQFGVELDFGSAASLIVLGEVTGGIGYPFILEYSFGGVAEVLFANKTIGFGVGMGSQTAMFNWKNLISSDSPNPAPGSIKSTYTRLSLIIWLKSKISIYVQHYGNGSFTNFSNWGFGVSFTNKMF